MLSVSSLLSAGKKKQASYAKNPEFWQDQQNSEAFIELDSEKLRQ
jgi:hypothetical protein